MVRCKVWVIEDTNCSKNLHSRNNIKLRIIKYGFKEKYLGQDEDGIRPIQSCGKSDWFNDFIKANIGSNDSNANGKN